MLGLNLGLSILAAVLVVVGLLLLWWRTRMGKEIALMAAIPTSKAVEAAKLAPGTLAEVKGTVRCAQPLTAEFSNQACVYFRAEITREETYYERDSDGKEQRRTRTSTIHSNIQHAPCFVEDDSGRVAVDLNNATIEAAQVIDQTEHPDALGGLIGSLVGLGSGGNYTYRRKEWLVATDVPIYLLGEVRAGGTIGAPAKGSSNKKFVFSIKSEEERTKSLGSTMTWVFWIAIVLFVLAALTLYWAARVGSS